MLMPNGPVRSRLSYRRGVAPAALVTSILALTVQAAAPAADEEASAMKTWQIGTPVVTYWAGPPMTDAVAQQMADGGWNLVWCTEKDLDVAQRHGLRAQLTDRLLAPAAVDDPELCPQLDALVDRVKGHPALYAYYLKDEPNVSAFPALGKLVEYLRQRDPAHLAYINLYPTYANNQQLGTEGDTVTAYTEHVRQYVDTVRPALISYDHYHFAAGGGDRGQYFLNLALIRQAAQGAAVPFLNIVQACTWTPRMRAPTRDEMRFLVYTTLAYGGQGISYFVYCWPGITGAIANPDGTPNMIYHALSTLNREFVAIASQLQPLRSLGVYHLGMMPSGGQPIPASSPFQLDPPVPPMDYQPPEKMKGMLLGYFGTTARPTHVLVVNLDYTQKATTAVIGPGPLELFDPRTGEWSPSRRGERAHVLLLPGGGKLLRVQP